MKRGTHSHNASRLFNSWRLIGENVWSVPAGSRSLWISQSFVRWSDKLRTMNQVLLVDFHIQSGHLDVVTHRVPASLGFISGWVHTKGGMQGWGDAQNHPSAWNIHIASFKRWSHSFISTTLKSSINQLASERCREMLTNKMGWMMGNETKGMSFRILEKS